MPVLNLSPIAQGWHDATIESFEMRESANHNPMIVVEVTLDSGELINGYLVITTHATELKDFLRAAGEGQVAAQIKKGRMPQFELDELIGRSLQCAVNHIGQITDWRPRANRS